MRLLATGLFLLTAIGVFGVLAEHFPGDGGLLIRLGIDMLLSFLVILIHELGHAAAAIRLGGRVSRIVVFPFAYKVQERRFGISKAMRGHEIGGYVAYTLDAIMARRKHKLVAAAGPAANVLLAIAAGAISALAAPNGLLGTLTGALASFRSAWRSPISSRSREATEAYCFAAVRCNPPDREHRSGQSHRFA